MKRLLRVVMYMYIKLLSYIKIHDIYILYVHKIIVKYKLTIKKQMS